ncbi:MAG: metallophosphoesterase [Nitrospirae bacterium]|jgi:uncharacterized protein|nr:metallophosphoesterase [Nitrospirota bacterium]
MTLFLFTFFIIYGGMHLYAFLKAKAAFAFHARRGVLIAVWMLIMIVTPVIIHVAENAGFELFAIVMSYSGYTWMGVLFLFICVSLVIDIYRLILYVAGSVMKKDVYLFMPPANLSFFIPLLISITIGIYGYFEARNIRTERIVIKTSKIPEEFNGFKIVQVSDVHIGLIVREGRLGKIFDIVKSENPDILVSTGDLVDGQIDNLQRLAEIFRQIKPGYGKFAVTGNHEFYAGLEQALNFTEKAGFTVLRGESMEVAGIIYIAGVDDPAGKYYKNYNDVSEKELLEKLPRDKFIILMKHRPLVDEEAIGLFDLQLSGHVHKGQIFPFSLITGLYYPAQAGFEKLTDISSLYVSRGSGTWGPPIRFLSPPEVTVIELISDM